MSSSQLCSVITEITGIMDWIFDVRAAFERDMKQSVYV